MDSVPTPLFILPLLAGFVFLKDVEIYRYEMVRLNGHQLYFRVAFWGFLFAVLIYLALWILAAIWSSLVAYECLNFSISLATQLNQFKLSLALVLSPLIGWIVAKPINWFADEYKWLWKALEKNELEMLLALAVVRDSLVMLTLGNGKVYCGYVDSIPDPARGDKKYINLLPVLSGYRDDEHNVVLTTKYKEILNRIPTDLDHLDYDNFTVVLPVRELVSIRLFDPEAYEAFNRNELDEGN